METDRTESEDEGLKIALAKNKSSTVGPPRGLYRSIFTSFVESQPVKLAQNRRDIVKLPRVEDQPLGDVAISQLLS
jgi:hypothetical protein